MEQQNDTSSSIPQMPMTYPTGMHSGNMVYMTNPDKELEKLEQNFRGYHWTQNGYVKRFDARMNEQGIDKVVGLVRSLVNRITFMSNLDDRKLMGLLEGMADTLVTVLMMNKEAFGIRSDDERSAIFDQCMNLAMVSTLRAYKGDDKRFWKGGVMELQYGVNNSQPPKSGGLLGKAMPNAWR